MGIMAESVTDPLGSLRHAAAPLVPARRRPRFGARELHLRATEPAGCPDASLLEGVDVEPRNVRVELSRAGGEWRLAVEEDGRGFDPERAFEGQGLASMRRRAERLGGRLTVASSEQGTRLSLILPR